MAKFFLILTILLTGAAAFFGFQTKAKIESVQKTVEKSKADTAEAKQKLSKATDDLKAAQKQTADANEKAATAEAAKSKAEADLTKATTDLTAANDKATQLQKDLDQAKDDLAKFKGQAPGSNAPPVDVAALEQKVKDAEAKAQEATLLAQSFQSKVKEQEDKIQAYAKTEAMHKAQVMRPGLEGQVMAVNPGWNFVVISLGDRQGAVANAQLIVKRGDTMIGRVKITSVEPSTSIADIVADSVPKGQRVLPGDRVVFPVQ